MTWRTAPSTIIECQAGGCTYQEDVSGTSRSDNARQRALLEHLDAVYPADVFSGESGDVGARLVALTRRLADAEAAAGERRPIIALRRQEGGLDDVVAKNVRTFRAEMMDASTLWIACYFDDAADERLTFHVRSKRGPLTFDVTEAPSDYEDFDAPFSGEEGTER